MNYSGTSNDLFTSFTKIGKEIDDIFSSITILTPQSIQSSQNHLKGSSAEFYDDPQYKPNITKSDVLSTEDRENSFSTIISDKYSGYRDEEHAFPRSVLAELSKQMGSTPSGKYRNLLDQQYNVSLSRAGPDTQTRFSQELSHYQSMLSNESRIVSKDIVEKEREIFSKHSDEVKLLRKQILDMTDRIQVTHEERNKIFFKLEAAIREISSQGLVKQGLTQKINDLNQKMLENDFEINQLKSQIEKLSAQLDSAHTTHEKLLEQLDQSYTQISTYSEERRKIVLWMEKASDETNTMHHKYELLQKLHSHCSTVSSNNQSERKALVSKIENLNKDMVKSDQEKNLLLQNLGKVYKLIETLESKATDKIKQLSQEVKGLENSNASFKETIQEKDAVLSMNRNSIRDLESKLGEYDFEISDIKRGVQSHEKDNQEVMTLKNKKIKMLSLKIKQLQNRHKTQQSQVDILTETNENLEHKLKEIQTTNVSTHEDKAAKIIRIKELEAVLENKDKKLSEYTDTVNEMRLTIQHLTMQTTTIQKDRQSKSSELDEVFAKLISAKEKIKSQEEEITHLQNSLSQQVSDTNTHLDQYEIKVKSQDKKILKLKESLNQIFSAKQEAEGELQEMRNAVESMKYHFDTTQTQLTQKSSELQDGLVGKISEQSLELEQYKQQIERLSHECDSKLYEMELDLNDANERYHNAQCSLDNNTTRSDEQQGYLLQAVEKYRQRNAKLKQKFQERLSEQNDIIDNCVDRTAAEHQIRELKFYYETLYAPLLTNVKSLKHITIGVEREGLSPTRGEREGLSPTRGEREGLSTSLKDQSEEQRDVDQCCAIVEKARERLTKEQRDVDQCCVIVEKARERLTKEQRDVDQCCVIVEKARERLTKEAGNICELRREVEKVSEEYETQIQSQQIYFSQEIAQLQTSLKRFTNSYNIEYTALDDDVLTEFDKMKEEERRKCKLNTDYERAAQEALSIEQKLRNAKRNILEYRADTQAVGVLEHKLHLQEQELIKSKEKVSKQRGRLRH